MGKKFESHILIRFPIYFALNAGMLKLFEGHIFTRLYCGLFILFFIEIDGSDALKDFILQTVFRQLYTLHIRHFKRRTVWISILFSGI